MGDHPGVGQSSMVSNDIHGKGGWNAVEVTRGDDIAAYLGGLSRQLSEFPSIDKTMRPLVFGALVPAFRE